MGPVDIVDVSDLLGHPAFWTVAHFLTPLIIIGSIDARLAVWSGLEARRQHPSRNDLRRAQRNDESFIPASGLSAIHGRGARR